MSDITIPNSFACAQVGTAKKINDNFAACTAVINGNIDTAQIADGSITDNVIAGGIAMSNVTTLTGLFSAYSGATQSFSGGDGSPEIVKFDNQLYDISAAFDPATYTYTVPADGIYYFHSSINGEFGAAGEDVNLYIYVNGSSYAASEGEGGASGRDIAINASWIISLSAADTVAIWFTADGGFDTLTNRVANYQTRWFGFLLAKT